MKTTEWFPIEMPPTRHGAFETQTAGDIACVGTSLERMYFNWWDGEKWLASGMTPDQAAGQFLGSWGTAANIVRWRGITEPAA